MQLPHKVDQGPWSAGKTVQYKKTADCIVGLSQQEFSTVINGLSAIIADLIRVSGTHCTQCTRKALLACVCTCVV